MWLILGSLLPALFCQLPDAGLDATAQESPIDLPIILLIKRQRNDSEDRLLLYLTRAKKRRNPTKIFNNQVKPLKSSCRD
jgi:hypothetical protein